MAEELGTWPAEQATVLLDVLQRAGLEPTAKRTREGVRVAVPDDQSDEAHRQLVTHMDTIAQAARPSLHPARGRPGKQARGRRASDTRRSGGSRLTSERLLRIARPVGIVLIALLVGALALGGEGVSPLLVILLVGVVVYIVGKRSQDRGEGPDDYRRGR